MGPEGEELEEARRPCGGRGGAAKGAAEEFARAGEGGGEGGAGDVVEGHLAVAEVVGDEVVGEGEEEVVFW